MQYDVAVPQALLQISHSFGTSAMGDMCFRLLNLRAAIKCGDITDPNAIREVAIKMDADLKTLQPSWSYVTVDASDTPAGTYFEGKRHIYSNLLTAQAWNSWRTLRIMVNRIIHQNEIRSVAPDSAHKSTALSHIHQFSTEICISAPNFIGSPRKHTSTPKCSYLTKSSS